MQPPWICAITGFVISSARFQASMHSRRKARRCSGCCATAPSALKSMPEENIAPAPRITTTRTSGAFAASFSAAPIASTSSPCIALRFSGRFRIRWRTAPRSSVSTSGMGCASGVGTGRRLSPVGVARAGSRGAAGAESAPLLRARAELVPGGADARRCRRRASPTPARSSRRRSAAQITMQIRIVIAAVPPL